MPPKPLPLQPPNPGERLVVRNLTTSGRYDWFYSSLTKAQIVRTNDPAARIIEIHIKNFRVSELEAALANFPNSSTKFNLNIPSTAATGTVGTAMFLVVDLDDQFSSATDQALEFIRTVGITSAPRTGSGIIQGKASSAPSSISTGNSAENMRSVLFQGVTVNYNASRVDGEQVLDFWDEIGTLRDVAWNQDEMARWVSFKWSVKRKMLADERGSFLGFTYGVWGLGAAAVASGLAWAYVRFGREWYEWYSSQEGARARYVVT